MRIGVKALAALAVATLPIVAVASDGFAAGLSLKPAMKRHFHHRGARAYRDYDGTAVIIRHRPDGQVDLISARRTNPAHYINGEPVRVGARIVVE
jgi:hypothetical protein